MPVPEDRTTFQRIAASWLSMKTWVKVRLFALNGLFLGALALLPAAEAKIVLLAYVASGPLLAYGMVKQRGLTRLLGAAHLVPWLPLVGYLVLRLSSDLLGPRLSAAGDPLLFTYLVGVLVATTVCLAADAYDIWRWVKGERFVLGSPEAARAGASLVAPARLPCEAMA